MVYEECVQIAADASLLSLNQSLFNRVIRYFDQLRLYYDESNQQDKHIIIVHQIIHYYKERSIHTEVFRYQFFLLSRGKFDIEEIKTYFTQITSDNEELQEELLFVKYELIF